MRAMMMNPNLGTKGTVEVQSVTLIAFILLVVLLAGTVVGGTLTSALNHAVFLLH
jgi:hypothetical protein